mgnify:CR=1 FL=1
MRRNRLNAIVGADVAGIYADFIGTCRNALKRAAVVKMYVRNNRNRNLFFYGAKSLPPLYWEP